MSVDLSSVLRDRYPDLFFFIDRDECGLSYSPRFREFSLTVRPRSAVGQRLSYCPFSGASLPTSLKDAFFDELEKLSLIDGLADMERAPEEFQSEAWWIARGL